jgi:protein gp37
MGWRKPRMVFVNSMSDLFHENLSDEDIERVFAVMTACPRHTFQILTKRPARMREFVGQRVAAGVWWDDKTPWLPNVWLGVSVEDQQRADERIPLLLKTPAALRFVSVEPMLGPVDLGSWPGLELKGINWVIAGCESGPGRRPAELDWFRSLAAQCVSKSVPFFLKQVEWAFQEYSVSGCSKWRTKIIKMPTLDGKVWDQRPEVPNEYVR